METAKDFLLAPRQLPDGAIAWEEQGAIGDAVRVMREYDPRLSLLLIPNRGWEIHRLCEDGERRRVGIIRGTGCPSGDQLVREVAAVDTWRGYDPIAAVDAHNAKIDADRAKELDDELEAAGDKLAWALGKDLDEPAQSGRLYPLGDG